MSSEKLEPATTETRRSQIMSRLFSSLQIERFNQIYYHRRSSHLRRLSLAASIVSALSASGALIAILKNDSFGVGPWVLPLLTGGAAVLAAIGPVLGWDAKASQMEKAALGHGIIMDRTKRLLQDLKISELEESHSARELELESFRMSLSALDEPSVEKVREASWSKALEEFPSEQAWTIL